MRALITLLSLAGLAGAVACGQDETAFDSESLQQELVQLNGLKVNGLKVNGLKINGLKINGLKINGTQIGTETSLGFGASDTSLAPPDLASMTIEAQMSDGSALDMRIDSSQQDPASHLWLYAVSYRDAKDKWQPLCGTSSGQPILALPLPGIYDEDTGNYTPDSQLFTFACTVGALAKCALWGYRPWAQKSECLDGTCKTQSLQPWHAACTRMVRADYCGDGVAHTRNGTSINVWDNLSLQLPEQTSWDMEAEWTPSGARCIRHTRWLQADKKAKWTDLEYIQRTCPERLASYRPSACDANTSDYLTQYGLHLDAGTRRLLRNQSQGYLTGTGKDKKGNRED